MGRTSISSSGHSTRRLPAESESFGRARPLLVDDAPLGARPTAGRGPEWSPGTSVGRSGRFSEDGEHGRRPRWIFQVPRLTLFRCLATDPLLRPGPSPRGDAPQRRLAGRSYGTRHPGQGRTGRPDKPWLTIILDDYSRAVAGYACRSRPPRRSRRPWPCARRSGARPTGLAGLRHPGGPLHRPRQRLHVPAPRAGGRRSQDPPDQLRGRAAPRPGEDRAVLRERLPGAPPAAARLCAATQADRKAELTLAGPGRRDRSGSWSRSTRSRRTRRPAKHRRSGGTPAASCRGCPSRWSSSTCCC